MTEAHDLRPGDNVKLVGTQTLFHYDYDYDYATGQLTTYNAGAALAARSVARDEDDPAGLQIAFGVDGNEVQLTCLGDTHFVLA